MKFRCCIVGGGPAGMMLGYLLGRAGVDTIVLEKHADFFRDFRGDTVHPSTLQVMDELGLIDGFLKLPHQRLRKMDGKFGSATIRIADLSRLKAKYPFIAFMPQWDFLNFLRESGQRFPSLRVMMNAEATDLIRSGETVISVKLAVQDAVATANLLAAKLADGCPSEQELDAVRRRREFPVRMTQAMQVVVQNNVISVALKPGGRPLKPPLPVRLINAVPWLQGVTARFVGLGVRPEHVHSPVAPTR
ncbi:FAD-dependent monooxygenase [Bradyrhizobium sediminis]|nr:FAD-dependent monooxygenase [Bradyrhizobium sediminis]